MTLVDVKTVSVEVVWLVSVTVVTDVVVVLDVVVELVGVVVGVVTSQSWNPPLVNVSTIAFKVDATALQFVVGGTKSIASNTQITSSVSPSGPVVPPRN